MVRKVMRKKIISLKEDFILQFVASVASSSGSISLSFFGEYFLDIIGK